MLHKINRNNRILSKYRFSILISFLYVSCATYETDHKKWIGVFLLDSVTAGAVRLDYHESSPKGNTFGNVEQYGVNVDLYRYNFHTKELKFDRRLFKNMGNANMYRITEYNSPFLLQGANYINGDNTVMFNLENGEKRILKIRVDHISQNKEYVFASNAIIKLDKMDTINIYNEWGETIYAYSEKYDKILKYLTTREYKRSETIYNSRFQITSTGDTMITELPEIKFKYSPLFGINWEEGLVGFSGDSASRLDNYLCNIDSVFTNQNTSTCKLMPKGLNKLEYVIGSLKSGNFIGLKTSGVGKNGIYSCSGVENCEPELVSSSISVEN
jgi:hypothetical protein